jgi:hypothetical protein
MKRVISNEEFIQRAENMVEAMKWVLIGYEELADEDFDRLTSDCYPFHESFDEIFYSTKEWVSRLYYHAQSREMEKSEEKTDTVKVILDDFFDFYKQMVTNYYPNPPKSEQ